MTTVYDYRVAIRVPEASRDAANQTVADITGNPVDLQTFSTRITDGAEVQYLSELWMREQYFALLDDFRAQLGGEFAIMAHRLDGVWVEFGQVLAWAEQAGFYLVEGDDDDNLSG
jgi:hypothetical protein